MILQFRSYTARRLATMRPHSRLTAKAARAKARRLLLFASIERICAVVACLALLSSVFPRATEVRLSAPESCA